MHPSRIAAVSCVLIVCAAACTHPVDEFKAGKVDSGKPDSMGLDSGADSAVDSTVDVGSDVDTGSVDTSIGDADVGGDGDAGPPLPEPCSAVLSGHPEMICINEGATSFDLGATNTAPCPSTGCPAEMPQVTVKITPFFIDEHEVTVGRFRAWWNSTSRTWPNSSTSIFSTGTKDYKWKPGWPTAPSAPGTSGGCTWISPTDASRDDKPLNCVDWYTALGFCLGDGGKRLPTEAEWELVASGGQNRLMPWSAPGTEGGPINEAELDCAHVIFGTCTPLTVSPTSTVWGRTKSGVWNMAGSLSEWVLDAPVANWSSVAAGTVDPFTDPTATLTQRVVRGGSYLTLLGAARDFRAAGRLADGSSNLKTVPTNADLGIGFRCVKR